MSLLTDGHDSLLIYRRTRSMDSDGNEIWVNSSDPVPVARATVRPIAQDTPEGTELFGTYSCFCDPLPDDLVQSPWAKIIWKGGEYQVEGQPITTRRSSRTAQTRWQMTSTQLGNPVGS